MSTATRQSRVFISRTTAGLKALAEQVAEVLRQRGIEPIIQTGFYPSTHDVKGMLAEHLQQQFTHPSGKKMSGKKWNPYFCHPCFCHQIFAPITFAPEPPELAQRQQTFITEFAKDGRNTYGTRRSANAKVGMPKWFRIPSIRHSKFPIRHFPGPLLKGREEFLAELRQHLTAGGLAVIKGKRAIHGMGGGKTRAAIEYAWKHAADYRALLFIPADTL